MMNNKILLLFAALFVVGQTSYGQSQVDFYFTPQSGPTLWCRYNDGPTGNSVTVGKTIRSGYGYNNTDGYSSDSTLIIPDSVTFNNHTYVVTAIGDFAFTLCTFLTSVTIPESVTSIGQYAFSSCSGLTSMTIPNSVTYMGEGVFSNSSNITSVTLPNTISSVSNQTFRSCFGLTSVTLPISINRIGQYAFCGCSSLSSVIIPNSVTCIDTGAFFQCNNLVSVTIGSAVSFIGYESFGYCCNLDTMYCLPVVPPTLGDENFGEPCSGYPQIIVSCSSFVAYQNATNWNVNALNIHSNPGSSYYYNVTSFDETIGSVNVSIIDCNYITITATPNYGYHFTHWSDGNTNNPRTITLTQDSSFTAYFEKNSYVVTVLSNNNTMGQATGGDTVLYLDSITISATSNYGYHFTHWQDNNTDNPRTVQVTQNKTYTAYFGYDQFTLIVQSDNTTQGNVSGGGNYNYLSNRTITATPTYGHHFTYWNDGVTENPRTITLTQDTSFTAHFAPNQYNLTVNAGEHGTATGSGTYNFGDTITIQAFPDDHYHFIRWNDGNTENPRQYRIEDDITLTAFFAIDTYTVVVVSSDIIRGMVEASGTEFVYGTPCTVTATAYTGYTFAGWSNGITANPYTFAVISDVELTAIFVPEDSVGVGNVEALNVRVYANKGQIVIEDAEGNDVTLYDLTGRILATRRDEWQMLRFDVPASGVYLVKVGDHTVRKVVVMM